MKSFWQEHKGAIIISLMSIVLGAIVQVGLMYLKMETEKTNSHHHEHRPSVITVPQKSEPVIVQPEIRYPEPIHVRPEPVRPYPYQHKR